MNTHKIKLYLFFITFFCVFFGRVYSQNNTDVIVTLRDEDGKSIQGANVSVVFVHLVESMDDPHRGNSNEDGIFQTSGKIVSSLLIKAEKDGFYPIRYDRALIQAQVASEKISKINFPLIMRRIKSPSSFFAKSVDLKIPAYNKPVGFDFEAGDWTTPYGKGKISDFTLVAKFDFLSYPFNDDKLADIKKHEISATEDKIKFFYGDWAGEAWIQFPDDKSGIVVVDKEYCSYSRLSMPHLAYDAGYLPEWHRKTQSSGSSSQELTLGYFLRTRVKLDGSGKIVAANYAKFTKDIKFDPRGIISFTYVFNPSVNDKNLEFDWKNNQFKKIDDLERVLSP